MQQVKQMVIALNVIREQTRTMVGLLEDCVVLSVDETEHLKWFYTRMVEVHGENPNFDYMIKIRQILGISDPKPKETVYEWQWYVFSTVEGKAFLTPNFYTVDEAVEELVTGHIKLEQTKRERVK